MADTAAVGTPNKRLAKDLGLWDVYAISTGAMFSSGFFLLPGLATAYAGPSTVLAYLVAGILMIPAMLSMSELSTALPRAGGTYYFLDRSLGPGAGTVGGLGTWLALVLKSAFALLGMGAYLAIAPGVASFLPGDPEMQLWVIKGIAVALTVAFAALNIIGAKETTRLQGLLVIALLSVLAFFVVVGLGHLLFDLSPEQVKARYTPFMPQENGLNGFFATVGLVFVSYAGLTKVASVSEEVKRPDRNLPLGMILSLITATTIYVVGVAIIIATVDSEPLKTDYTPVATSASQFLDWLPGSTGLILIVIAALAAFASTGNAGILSASRYPLAMGRDRLLPAKFNELGRFGTPTLGILVTAGLMIFFILALSAEGVAKVASAFNLFVFGLMNISVIVMRESKIESYDPGFRSPFYPWTQLLGVVIAGGLILEMGPMAVIASFVLGSLGAAWYWYYARNKVVRDGAIYHVFSRLGQRRFEELDREFRQIIKEKGLRENDPFNDLVARARLIDAGENTTYDQIADEAAEHLTQQDGAMSYGETRERIADPYHDPNTVLSHQAMLPHFRLKGLSEPELVLVRCRTGLAIPINPRPLPQTIDDSAATTRVQRREAEQRERRSEAPDEVTVRAIFFLISPDDAPGLHLRVLAQIATRLESEGFMESWCQAPNEQKLKETLLHHERYVAIRLQHHAPSAELIGTVLADLALPDDTLVAMIHRDGQTVAPHGRMILQLNDRLTVIGATEGIATLRDRFGGEGESLDYLAGPEKAAT
ncbi:MAG: amino acid permease [Planctomycetota bacterium]